MKTNISIRKVTEHDYAQMATLIQDKEEHLWVFPSATFPMDVAQIKERAQKREFTVVLEADKVIGFSNLYKENGHLYIGNVAIASEQRGQGYGKKLMIIMIERARKVHQAQELMISVVTGNDTAKELYETLGFSKHSIEVFRTDEGQYLTFLHMKKTL